MNIDSGNEITISNPPPPFIKGGFLTRQHTVEYPSFLKRGEGRLPKDF